FYKEGVASSVAIIKGKNGGHVTLLTNGHGDATDSTDMTVQELLAYFPLFCLPDPQQIAVVGWGSGVTIGCASQLPVKHIDAVELEACVPKAARSFNHVNYRPDENPRVALVVNDGRNHLLATTDKYDAILSEPSNPWQ